MKEKRSVQPLAFILHPSSFILAFQLLTSGDRRVPPCASLCDRRRKGLCGTWCKVARCRFYLERRLRRLTVHGWLCEDQRARALRASAERANQRLQNFCGRLR